MFDPPLFGSDDNYSFSTMQINISPLDRTDLSSLGTSGEPHIDCHDDPISLTLVISMSYLKLTMELGKFYIGETKDWCRLWPFLLLIFHGNNPHAGTYRIARFGPDSPKVRLRVGFATLRKKGTPKKIASFGSCSDPHYL